MQNLPKRHLSILCGRIQFLEALEADSAKTCSGRPRERRPTEMEFDHELRLWLKSKKSRKTHLDTRVEAAQSDREIARGMDVINTGRSAGIILTGCNYAGHCPK